jgi:hypothetical protein
LSGGGDSDHVAGYARRVPQSLLRLALFALALAAGSTARAEEPATVPPAHAPVPTYPSDSEQYPDSYPQTQPIPPTEGGYFRPRAVVPEPSRCCLWSIRYDPFDLIWRRVSFAAEIAWGKLPITIELTPKYIFDSPAEDIDEQGFDLGVNLAWYPGGKPLRGLWVKAHAEYESVRATLTRTGGGAPVGKPNPEHCDGGGEPGTCSRRVSSVIVGLMLGSTYVFGKNGGFSISGGIGVGAALASSKDLEVLPCTAEDVAAHNPYCSAAEPVTAIAQSFRYYDDAARIRLLGTLGLGIAF